MPLDPLVELILGQFKEMGLPGFAALGEAAPA
jgi:hypothetical protein